MTIPMIDINEAKCLWNCGATLASIADLYGVTRQAVWQRLRYPGKPPKREIVESLVGRTFASAGQVRDALGLRQLRSSQMLLKRLGYHLEFQRTYRIVKNPPEEEKAS